MKFEREYLLKADLREVIYEWAMDIDITSRTDIKKLAEQIFYRLLHAGDLKDERPTYRLKGCPSGEKWIIDITGLNDEEAKEKIKKVMEDARKKDELTVGFSPKTVYFKPKGLKMKVDADSPFKGEAI